MREYKQILIDQIPGLSRYALALLGNYALAEKLVQDTLERALKHRDQWDSRKAIKPWLFQMLHYAFIDIQRRQEKSSRVDAILEEISLTVTLPLPDLAEELSKLTPEQREILLMISLEGFNYMEISNITGVPLGTLMSCLHSARKQLVAGMDRKVQNKKIEHTVA